MPRPPSVTEIIAKQTTRPDQIRIMAEGMLRYINSPTAFVRDLFKADPDPWQEKALEALPFQKKVSIPSGHGVGKTTWLSWAIWWFLFTRPNARIPCTAPTRQQLFDVLWPELAKWQEKSPVLKSSFEWQKTRIIQVKHPERWFATAKTSNKPENLAGFHEDHLLFVVDEASGVADEIFEVIEGALTTKDCKLLLCGNPTKASGRFFESITTDKANGIFWSFRVSCEDSPRVSREYIDGMIKKYGKDSNVVRVRVFGLPPKDDPDVLIPIELVSDSVLLELFPVKSDILEFGLDVARFGDDETVLAGRRGPCLQSIEAWTKEDTVSTAKKAFNRVVEEMIEQRVSKAKIKVDDTGVGGGVTDNLRRLVTKHKRTGDIIICPCHNGGSPEDKAHFTDWATEQWCKLKDGLNTKSIKLLADEDLEGQLSTRRYGFNSKSKLRLETKDEMKSRGLRSPDRAEAVVLAFANPSKRKLKGTAKKPKGF